LHLLSSGCPKLWPTNVRKNCPAKILRHRNALSMLRDKSGNASHEAPFFAVHLRAAITVTRARIVTGTAASHPIAGEPAALRRAFNVGV
jgi:hypothetical protein